MFWSIILIILVANHKANGIFTDSNDLSCTHVKCPTECPADSYLKSSVDEDEEDYEDGPYVEELGHFEELPIDVENYDLHLPQHSLKERQKREVFFQEEIDKCCHDQKCVCHKCEDVPICNKDQVAIEVHEGQGVPGNCCSLFKCVNKVECQMGVKQTWWANKCRKCFCFGENELCTQICPEEEIPHHCYSEYWQQPKMNGESWKEGRCTSCSCEQGKRRCFIPVCPKSECNNTKTLEDECCPKCVVDTEVNEKEINEARMCYSEILQKPMLNGDSWKEGTNTTCTCKEGEIECFTPECPKLECKDTKLNEGDLCPICIEEVNEGRIEIVHNKEDEIEYNEDELSTESTTIDVPTIQIEQRNKNRSSYPIIDDTLINEGQTTSPLEDLEETSPVSISFKDIEEISSTMEPEAIDFLEGNVSTKETSTTEPLSSSTYSAVDTSSTTETFIESNKIIDLEKLESTTNLMNSTTEQSISQAGIDLASTTTEIDAKSVVAMEDNSSSTTEEVQTTSETNISESSTETLYSKETTTSENLLASSTLESSTELTSLSSTNEASSTIAPSILSSTLSTTEDPQTTTTSSSIVFSTSAAFETSSTTETVISSTTEAKTTTDTPLATSSQTSTEYSSSSTSSFSSPSSSSPSTSTTSSPFSSTSDAATSTEFFVPQELSSSTSGPEPLKPLFQPYGGDFNSEERSFGTQNQMRILFDEIDYYVMIALFVGSLFCIALVIIIRRTKNRKKMYSSIPNSETSLSQNSTNTVLTV